MSVITPFLLVLPAFLFGGIVGWCLYELIKKHEFWAWRDAGGPFPKDGP